MESTGKEHKEKTEELKDNEDSIISTPTKEEKNNDTLPSFVTARVTVDGEVEVSAEIKDGNWLSVSPGKARRSNEKRLESETVISPSRFQLLAEEEDEQSTTHGTEVSATDPALQNDVEDVEEGEILQKDELLAEEEDEQSTTQGTEVSATDPALQNDVEDVEEGEILQRDEIG
ncbi:hypothetical protein DY000_02005812 [Brassica cretica]|uniref:Uncharacterized protein n=1 Tax=Brassica cretica TaxID=69181 RepID=A0ABQ7BW56_BRACR|nr:hypothetical protein DY000_02005812 [Brassica cretica]